MNTSDNDKIESRLASIEAIIAALGKEKEDLLTAQRVIRQLNGAPETVVAGLKVGAPRPEGIPTTFEMVEFVLRSAEKEGKAGLSISELIGEIRKRYWPGLTGPQIAPIIYGFASSERILKNDAGIFRLRK